MHQTRQNQLKLYQFQLADCILNAQHGIATFVKNWNFSHVGKSDNYNPTERMSIQIENPTIVNVYHPPSATLDITSLPISTENFIAAGDLNCRHENWGYSDPSLNGKKPC